MPAIAPSATAVATCLTFFTRISPAANTLLFYHSYRIIHAVCILTLSFFASDATVILLLYIILQNTISESRFCLGCNGIARSKKGLRQPLYTLLYRPVVLPNPPFRISPASSSTVTPYSRKIPCINPIPEPNSSVLFSRESLVIFAIICPSLSEPK